VGRWTAKSPTPAERWTTRRLEGESPYCSYPLSGGPPDAWNILIVSRQRAQGRCFSDLRHSEAFENFSRIELVTKNDLASRRGYFWGPSSPKVLQEKTPLVVWYANWHNTKVQAKATIQGASAWQRLETKGNTDLKSKRPFNPW
jgi:hypothetical protein